MDQNFIHTLEALRANRFAVVDGALIDGTQRQLARRGYSAQGLYLDPELKADVSAGPYLVATHSRDALLAVLEIAGESSGVVFWSWPGNACDAASIIYRHLRTLTRMAIPLNADASRSATETSRFENVLFRLADANVVAATFPVLTPEQQARFLGMAVSVAMFAPNLGGVRAFQNPHPVSPTDKRPITLTQAQYDKVIDTYRRSLINRAIRTFAPRLSGSPDAIQSRIEQAFQRAESHGFAEQPQIFEFIRLDLLAGWGFEQTSRFADAAVMLRQPRLSPDQKISLLRIDVEAELGGTLPW